MAKSYRGTDIRNLTTNRRWFGIEDLGVVVRGEKVVLPSKAGQTDMAMVDDYRRIRVHGHVLGTDRANWLSECAAIDAVFDPALTSGTLVDEARSISAYVYSIRRVDVIPELLTEYDFELRAIGDPPDWA